AQTTLGDREITGEPPLFGSLAPRVCDRACRSAAGRTGRFDRAVDRSRRSAVARVGKERRIPARRRGVERLARRYPTWAHRRGGTAALARCRAGSWVPLAMALGGAARLRLLRPGETERRRAGGRHLDSSRSDRRAAVQVLLRRQRRRR